MKKIGINVEIPMRVDKFDKPRSPDFLPQLLVPSSCYLWAYYISNENRLNTTSIIKQKNGSRKEECGYYHSIQERLHAFRLMGVVPHAELFPRSREQKLAPGANKLIQENPSFTI